MVRTVMVRHRVRHRTTPTMPGTRARLRPLEPGLLLVGHAGLGPPPPLLQFAWPREPYGRGSPANTSVLLYPSARSTSRCAARD